jgi:hypothetical protein
MKVISQVELDKEFEFLEKQKTLLKTEREKIMLERSRLYYQWKEIQETDESIQKDQDRIDKLRGDLQYELQKVHIEIQNAKEIERNLILDKERTILDNLRAEIQELIAIEKANLENMKKEKKV